MAGIGFRLRKILERRSFTAYAQAYLSALAYASGPWICTIVALAGIVTITRRFLPLVVVEQFTVAIVYIYAFSLLLSGPFQVLTTRFVSDRLYEKNEQAIVPGVCTALAVTIVPAALLGALCAAMADLPASLELSAVFLFCLVCGMWQMMSYISCLKNYRLVTWTFLAGMLLACVLSIALARVGPFPLLGLMWGYIAGHLLIFLVLAWAGLRELPGEAGISREYLGYIVRFPALLLVGFLAALSIWTDKFVVWGFHGSTVWGIFLFHPPYDIPAYLAYLSAMPSTAFFLIKVETGFAETYERFIRSLQLDPAAVVAKRKEEMIRSMRDGLSQLLSFQGVITLTCLLAAPRILMWAGLGTCPPLLFRTLLLAAFCHFAFLHTIIFLMYFDKRRELVELLVLFVSISGAGSALASWSGEPSFYGAGYCAAAATAFVVAVKVLFRRAEDVDGDILFVQPLLDARGRVIEIVDCDDDRHGGRLLFRS